MRLRLIDYKKTECGLIEIYDGRIWGNKPVLTFEMEDRTRKDVRGYRFHHGDYDEVEINNVEGFGEWVATRDFDSDTTFNFEWLDNLVDEYLEIKEGKDG